MNPRLTWEADRLVAVELPPELPVEWTPVSFHKLDTELAAMPFSYPPVSEFRRKVWDAIRQIPFGKTITYQQLAEQIGNPGAARAVGSACGANRLLLAVPCHRVVARHGLGGFALGLDWKRKLLALEAAATAGSATSPA